MTRILAALTVFYATMHSVAYSVTIVHGCTVALHRLTLCATCPRLPVASLQAQHCNGVCVNQRGCGHRGLPAQ